MTSALPRRIQVATGLLAVALVAAGCGSSAASAPTGPTSPAGVTPTGAPSEAPTVATTPTDEVTPSSDVAGSTELTAWLTQVCTAVDKTLVADNFKPDVAAITKDPQAGLKQLAQRYTQLGAQMNSMADQLEAIGAPDVPNGKQFTDTYIDVMRQLGTVYGSIADGLPKNPTLPQVMAAMQKLNTPQLKTLMKRLEATGKLLDTDQITNAAKSVPECKKLDFGS